MLGTIASVGLIHGTFSLLSLASLNARPPPHPRKQLTSDANISAEIILKSISLSSFCYSSTFVPPRSCPGIRSASPSLRSAGGHTTFCLPSSAFYRKSPGFCMKCFCFPQGDWYGSGGDGRSRAGQSGSERSGERGVPPQSPDNALFRCVSRARFRE